MTASELERVEDIANDIVLQNAPVTTRLMALDDARASGARALFGENTATRCAWSRWARVRATTWVGRSNCAAAPM